jgi:hypothetical protein
MQTQLMNLVEMTLEPKLQARESFTALDISNALKRESYPIRHRDVAEAVRDLYSAGAMDSFGYARTLITVMAEGDSAAQAYLYHPLAENPHFYHDRAQEALPLPPRHLAKDIADTVPATPLLLLPRRAPAASRSAPRTRAQSGRRDGALEAPRRLLKALGWTAGDTLALRLEANGGLILEANQGQGTALVQVWGGLRLRICKTKLQLGRLSIGNIALRAEGAALRLEPEA